MRMACNQRVLGTQMREIGHTISTPTFLLRKHQWLGQTDIANQKRKLRWAAAGEDGTKRPPRHRRNRVKPAS